MRAAFVLVALAACVDTASEYHCTADKDCMLDGTPGRCEPTGHCSVADQSCGMLGFRYHASAGSEAGICVLGAGPMQEVPPFDLKSAHDSVHSSCAPANAKDVSFELTTTVPEVLAIDTGLPGSEAVAISLHAGPCPASTNELACAIQTCGPVPYASLAMNVAPGTYCITVEEAAPAGSSGGSTGLRVMHSSRPALVLDRQSQPPQQMTCGGPADPMPPTCGSPSPDPSAVALMMVCPGSFDITANVNPQFSASVALRQGFPGSELDCKAGTGPLMLHALAMIPGPYWIAVDHSGAPPACGPFDLTVMLTPH